MKLNPPNAHRSQFAKRGKRKMCSFGSCQTRFKFLSQFRKVFRNTGANRVWPMKINVTRARIADAAAERRLNHSIPRTYIRTGDTIMCSVIITQYLYISALVQLHHRLNTDLFLEISKHTQYTFNDWINFN